MRALFVGIVTSAANGCPVSGKNTVNQPCGSVVSGSIKYDQDDFNRHIDYIYCSPVKPGTALYPAWLFS